MTYLVRQLVSTILNVLQYMLLFRAILSWIPSMREGRISQVLYQITEPLIAPFRSLLSRIPGMQGFPLDISFLLAYFALTVSQRLLYIY